MQKQSRLLVIDNYDSFTFNLVQMFLRYPLEIRTVRSDEITPAEAEAWTPDYILISPGPKNPDFTGISMPLIRLFHQRIPILGVCLGMQCINAVFAGRTVHAPLPTHGKTSCVHHDGTSVFAGLPSPFIAARYHSLMISPAERSPLRVTARSEDGVIMGVAHPHYPLHGVQFHPESFLTEHGFRIVENFLRSGRMKTVPVVPENGANELQYRVQSRNI